MQTNPSETPWNACKHSIPIDRNDGLSGSNPGSGIATKPRIETGFLYTRMRFMMPTVVVPLTGGTGKFPGAHGRVKSTSIGNTNNSDITITFSG